MEIRSSKTKLFLIELIIIILFFAIASVVCMNIFAAAKTTNVKSTDLTNALFEVQGAAELVRAGDIDELPAAMGARDGAGGLVVYYDAAWNKTDAAGAKYEMDITPSREAGMLTCGIRVSKAGDVIYETTVKHFEGDLI